MLAYSEADASSLPMKLADQAVCFAGPSADIIRRMGDKIEAKKIVCRAGVSTVPGSEGVIAKYSEALAVASEVNIPCSSRSPREARLHYATT